LRSLWSGVSALKRGKNFVHKWCELKEISIKGHTENLGGKVKWKRGASQSEKRLMRCLVEVRAQEAVCAFIGVNWETPFQGQFRDGRNPYDVHSV